MHEFADGVLAIAGVDGVMVVNGVYRAFLMHLNDSFLLLYKLVYLTHFEPKFQYSTPWKLQKTIYIIFWIHQGVRTWYWNIGQNISNKYKMCQNWSLNQLLSPLLFGISGYLKNPFMSFFQKTLLKYLPNIFLKSLLNICICNFPTKGFIIKKVVVSCRQISVF